MNKVEGLQQQQRQQHQKAEEERIERDFDWCARLIVNRRAKDRRNDLCAQNPEDFDASNHSCEPKQPEERPSQQSLRNLPSNCSNPARRSTIASRPNSGEY